MTTYNRHTAYIGFSSVGLFIISFALFSQLNSDFHPLTDYISQLGAKGQPFGIIWNITGFALVGCLCALFGWRYGKSLDDYLIATCLVVAGLSYALAAVPTDIENFESTQSKIHFALICLSMAGWCFALARLAHIGHDKPRLKYAANWTITLIMLPLAGWAVGLYGDQIVQRLFILAVFSWIVFTCYDILKAENNH